MSSGTSPGPSYVNIWAWLVGLLAASLLIAFLPMADSAVVVAIFAFAIVKAVLVARHYMHLKHEPPLILILALGPLLLAIAMVIAFIPDIVIAR